MTDAAAPSPPPAPVESATATTATPRNDRPDGVVLLAIWYLVLAGGAFFAACVTSIPIGLFSFASHMPGPPRFLGTALFGFGVLFAMACMILLLAVAWGLWHLQEWARVLLLFVSVTHLPFFPIGTAIGVVTLWYMGTHDDVQRAFKTA